MVNKDNPAIGENAEALFCNSVGDHLFVIESIQKAFGIAGRYVKSIRTGTHGEKCDVKMSFADGRNVDANIKSYLKLGTMFNQVTRSNLSKFQKIAELSDEEIKELRELFSKKAENSDQPLIPELRRGKWRGIMERSPEKIVKWALSRHPSREILVLNNRTDNVMAVYKMSDLLKDMRYDISYTPKGKNIRIGDFIILQRKGGDGNIIKMPKTDPSHPSNDLQVKLDIKGFLKSDVRPLIEYDI